jgi:fructose-bisphosphate aldolase class II
MKFQELGLVSPKALFKDAIEKNYLVGAFNFNNLEELHAIVEAATETQSPIILQAAWGGVKFIKPAIIPHLVKGGVEYSKAIAAEKNLKPVPMALNLDHGSSLEECENCCKLGFSAIMIDGSRNEYEENVRLTTEVVKMARAYDPEISVEGELGILGGEEDHMLDMDNAFTDPKQAEDFIKRTGIDCLAISVGTSHGAKKYTESDLIKDADGNMVPPPLRMDIVEEISKLVPNFPLVLHGASAVPQNHIANINKYGGQMTGSIGILDAYVRGAANSCISKVNIHSDGRIAFMSGLRQSLSEKPASVEERYFTGIGKEFMKEYYMQKMQNVLMCAGKA